MENALREEPDSFEHMTVPNSYGGSIKILVVEDSDADMEILRQTLIQERISNIPDHVHNADEAIKSLKEKKYDWIIIDRNLRGSGIAGDELIKMVCKNPQYNKSRLIVLSGQEMTIDDLTYFDDLDIHMFFPKPLTYENIRDIIKASKNLWKDIYKRHEVA